MAQLTRELREYILETVSHTGGHLAPSLGVVELTLALHHIFESPRDKIVWDVGHQAYAHKILTGRRDAFPTVRQHEGISGFPKPSESEHDAFGVGHASTAISAALGMACARDLKGDTNHVIAVVGDGALTGGLAFEGLNNAGASGKNLIVILNDNSMSISPNVGALSRYLTNLISNPLYNRFKDEIWALTGRLDRMGDRIRWATRRLEESIKNVIMPGLLFERLGFRYFGPVDGHNLSSLVRFFQEVKRLNGPILVHVQTKKGRGFKPAEDNASIFHGLGRFDRKTGQVIKTSTAPSYTRVFGDSLVSRAQENDRLVAITAAMSIGTGLTRFSETFPDRFFDVGIAEGHAVTFAAGLASQGYHPVAAIYSSFLQRAYDHVIHDVALQNLPVIFAIDRAGLVGDDGPTHHGVFDIAFLRSIPELVVMAPKDEEELRHCLYTAERYKSGPVAIRYPRGQGEGVELSSEWHELPMGRAEVVRKGDHIVLLAVGPLVHRALEAAESLEQDSGVSVQVVNARYIKPLDTGLIDQLADRFECMITLEEGVLQGGFGSAVLEHLTEQGKLTLEFKQVGIPDHFVDQGSVSILHDELGLSARGICQVVRDRKTYRSLVLGSTGRTLKTA
jgi:1-deoxy-D-xylulose-5-phosphate synthase